MVWPFKNREKVAFPRTVKIYLSEKCTIVAQISNDDNGWAYHGPFMETFHIAISGITDVGKIIIEALSRSNSDLNQGQLEVMELSAFKRNNISDIRALETGQYPYLIIVSHAVSPVISGVVNIYSMRASPKGGFVAFDVDTKKENVNCDVPSITSAVTDVVSKLNKDRVLSDAEEI